MVTKWRAVLAAAAISVTVFGLTVVAVSVATADTSTGDGEIRVVQMNDSTSTPDPVTPVWNDSTSTPTATVTARGTDRNRSNPTPRTRETGTQTPASTAVTPSPSPTVSPTPSPSPTPTATATVTPSGEWTRLDRFVQITDWRYDENREVFVIEFRSDRPVTVSGLAGGQHSEGARTGAATRDRTARGTDTIEFDAPAYSGEAQITLTTKYSFEEGRYVSISTGVSGENPFKRIPSTTALVGGAVFGMLSGLIALRRILNRSGSPEEAW